MFRKVIEETNFVFCVSYRLENILWWERIRLSRINVDHSVHSCVMWSMAGFLDVCLYPYRYETCI